MGTTQPHIKITSLMPWKIMRYAASLLIILGLKRAWAWLSPSELVSKLSDTSA
jgi:hypothetical protein